MADLSVRPALADDAPALGRLHAANFLATLACGLGDVPAELAAELSPQLFERQWGAAITQPPSAKHRVLTALSGARVVGFAALAPTEQLYEDETGSTGPEAEIVALEVAPADRRLGHGSRLLAAATDILRATGADAVQTWCVPEDEARTRFLMSAGFQPRGVRRRYEVAGHTLTENAWYARLD